MGCTTVIITLVLWKILSAIYDNLSATILTAMIIIPTAYLYYKYTESEKYNSYYHSEAFRANFEIKQWQEKQKDFDTALKQLEIKKQEIQKEQQNALQELNWKKADFYREQEEMSAELQSREKLLSDLKSIDVIKFPVIADAFTDYKLAYDDYIEHYLRTKPRPAKTAADNVKLLRQQKKELLSQLYAYKWELKYLRELLPWIEDLEDSPMQEIKVSTELALNEDAALKWITPTEYETLSNVEKYQLALDRYKNKKKSHIEIGRDYERYIGYLYEMDGYKVTFFGIRKGLEDLGRDLICEKNGQTHIVQCKCWSKKKEIHENHINQLFGTTTSYYLSTLPNNSGKRKSNIKKFVDSISKEKIIPVFYSSTTYSDTAIKVAELLGVQLNIVELAPYPMVKCNINPSTKERIYHLPFDQQYDHCMINPEIGEFYAETVQEAENNGFRRAQHWSGTFHK